MFNYNYQVLGEVCQNDNSLQGFFYIGSPAFSTVESQINVSQIKDKSQIKDIICTDQIFTT